jgi:N-acetyl-anhydromuramyl-L-alanine amidase AmpD
MVLTRILEKGCQGDDVKELQTRLKNAGFFSSTIDDDFGDLTTAAVKAYQKSKGLTDDGVVGNTTWNSFGNTVSDTLNDTVNTTPPDFEIHDKLITSGHYFQQVVKKKFIVLHHTAGGYNPENSINGWNTSVAADGHTPLPVATAYIIGRKSSDGHNNTDYDGKIYRTFDDKYWAHHLGIKNVQNNRLNQESIAIEICNYGPLTKTADGRFLTYVNSEVSPDDVVTLSKPYKGFIYYEKYTTEQIESMKKLVKYLCDKYSIEIQHGGYDESWFEYNDKFMGDVNGIATHTNFRTDKFDLSPQPDMIAALNTL